MIDDGLDAFLAVRPRLFGIAYRMLGTVAEAEDVLQDAWLRWARTDRAAVRTPEAFLVTTVTRLSLNALTAARVRRESYIGPWLPEPVDTGADPTLGAERDEALNLAVLRVMERLRPRERAAYVLREAFDYPYGKIAEILETSPENSRQLVSRARAGLAGTREATVVDAGEQKRMMHALVAASRAGDLAGLERLFAEQVTSYADGNGLRGVARRPVRGRAGVAQYVLRVVRHNLDPLRDDDFLVVNGMTAMRFSIGGEPAGVFTAAGGAGGLVEFYAIMAPEKVGVVTSPR